ncbi:hypothetical protein NC653_026116 [Populus alba x Populus x berolinensis]|uniref:Uncharacterized protein n=1 Tax=Populus alba x Populus x berolinensis TaxID=444605 RepID=A0AAD6ME17_9ROSI|nr:hypothetical protein NC653_026116 [Populus alba x Populus x berolinensis]
MLDKMEAKKQEIMVASFFIASTAALRGPVMLLQTLSSRSLDHQTKIILMLYKSDPISKFKYFVSVKKQGMGMVWFRNFLDWVGNGKMELPEDSHLHIRASGVVDVES